MTNLTGKTLSERYHIEESLGRGGMAEVYKAWDNQRATFLALKVLREDLSRDLIFLRRFQREALTLAKLQHPNIVRFYGIETDRLNVFMLMDYIEGPTLQDKIFLSKGQPLHQDFIWLVMKSVCSALHYAHSLSLVHCDIKPGNIMINQHGEVLLTDFGIARMTDTATATMVGFGTPAYMAPELVQGRDPTPQSDIYSLGVVLYEMVTGGERPFTGERAQTTGMTSEKVRWEQVHLAAPSPRDFNPTIPSIQEAAILKCLAKAPEERFAGALDLLNDLKLAKTEAEEPLPEMIASTPIPLRAEPKIEIRRPVEGQAGSTRSNFGNERVIAPGRGFFSQLPKNSLLIAVGSVLFVILVVIGMNLLGGRESQSAVAVDPPGMDVAIEDTPVSLGTVLSVENSKETSMPINNPTAEIKIETITTVNPVDGAVMVYVPAGEFIMGSDHVDAQVNEKPDHLVYLDTFWIYQHEVTNSEYRQCVKVNKCEKPKDHTYFETPTYNNHPVVYVTWKDAAAYCKWAGGRLPTEAEWEKAARGIDGRLFPWHNQTPSCNYSNYSGCIGGTTSVGSFPDGASPYGALDMAGNVWEWVSDWYEVDYYSRSSNNNPKGPVTGTYRVLRGGSWNNSLSILSVTNRLKLSPDLSNFNYGFRCLQSQ